MEGVLSDYLQQQTDGPGKGLWMLDPGGDHVKQYDSFLKSSNRADYGCTV
jgi:hypothetical protein